LLLVLVFVCDPRERRGRGPLLGYFSLLGWITLGRV